MLGMSRKKPQAQGGRKLPQVLREGSPAAASPATITRGSQSAAIETILEACPEGEGTRIIVAGASGKGKTFFAVRLIREMQRRRLSGTAVIHDVKDPERPLYEGKLVHTVDQARRAVLEAAPDFLVCRPGIGADEAAGLVRDLCEAGEPATLLIDEMSPALRVNEDTGEPCNQIFAGGNLVWLQLQARGLRGSSVILVQLPRQVPTCALDNAVAYVFFGVGGRSLEYSKELRLVPKEAADLVAKLERGQCCVFFADREWDRTVYGPE
jgi:hypothetical protein